MAGGGDVAVVVAGCVVTVAGGSGLRAWSLSHCTPRTEEGSSGSWFVHSSAGSADAAACR